jgi:5-(hydroxymethyl)furfural/furfural oxidase
VKARVKGRETELRGNEVILSCGAIHSPAHLLRAGIGPAMALKDLGIEVRANVQGVGQRLQDHPSVALAAFIRPHARMNDFTRRHIQVALRYSSELDGVPAGDMFVAAASKSAWHAVGYQIGSMILCVYKTYSEAGQVKLASADWRAEPVVEFNLLSDRRDLDRLMTGTRRLFRLYEHPALRAATSDPFPASWGDKVRQVGAVSAKNRLLTGLAARLLDGPEGLRRFLMDRLVLDGYTFDQVMTDDDALEEFIRKTTVGVWHASCTCRMGSADDPMAVTNPAGRVRGVQGLRVVDASVFPVVPCANTNFPTLMTAEKISQAILDGA